MFIPGKTFSENYASLVKIHKTLGADNLSELVNKWASDVVDALMDNNPSKTYDKYRVIIIMEPNPIHLKGVDKAAIKIECQHPETFIWSFFMQSGTHTKIEDCIQAINKKMDALLPPPEEVTLNGKKYKLVKE